MQSTITGNRRSPRHVMAAIALLMAAALVPTLVDPAAAAAPEIVRLSGADRQATAIAVAEAAYGAGTDVVVLARADAYPDALAGGVLAGAAGGPVLLVGSTKLDASVAAAINRLGATSAYVLGGTSAVSQSVVDAVEAGTTVEVVTRLAGDTRFDTAAAVADEVARLTGGVDAVIVVEGLNTDPQRGWPDAVSAGQVAASAGTPLLLTRSDALPAETSAAIQKLGVDAVTIVGGDVAVSAVVEQQLEARVDDVTRILGADRWATSVAVADTASVTAPFQVWLTTGRNYPDALAAGPAVAKAGGVLLLVDGAAEALPDSVATWLAAHRGDVDQIIVVGGETAVSTALAEQAADLLDEDTATPTPTPTSSPEPVDPGSSTCAAEATFLVDYVNAYERDDEYADPELAVSCDGSTVTVQTNDIPTFEFVQITPNDLQEQNFSWTFTTTPTERDEPGALPLGTVGATITGLALFGAFEAPMNDYGDPVTDGLLDFCNGHTAGQGDYHGHARMDCILDDPESVGTVFGWLFDGYPIMTPWECTDDACTSIEAVTSSYVRVDESTNNAFEGWEYQEGAGDLDVCNGRTDSDGVYRYYATDAFPYLPFCFHGVTDVAAGDFDGTAPDGGGAGGPGGGGVPPSRP